MTKPPIPKVKQVDYVQTAVRLPRALRDDLREAAIRNGRTMNAEIIARLQASPLDELAEQNEEIKRLLRELLDRS